MQVDVGKSAKTKGSVRPRDARRIDPELPKATRAALKRRLPEMVFGISYESKELAYEGDRIVWRWPGRTCYHWYETPKRRDQALKSFQRRYKDSSFYRNHQAVDRVSGNAGGGL